MTMNTTIEPTKRGSLKAYVPVRMSPATVVFADTVAANVERTGLTRSDVIRALIEAGKAAALASGSLVINGQPVTLNLRAGKGKSE